MKLIRCLILAIPLFVLAFVAMPDATVADRAQAITITASVSPAAVNILEMVSYEGIIHNHGDVDARDVQIHWTLPEGFSYQPGSAQLSINGMLITTADPSTDGRVLTFSAGTLPAGRTGSFFGINTFVQDACEDTQYRNWQLDRALELMGPRAFVKDVFHGIAPGMQNPKPCWVAFIDAVYDRGLQPVIRLQGKHNGDVWEKPYDIGGMARAFRSVVEGLPRRDGFKLYVQIWNEPNLNLEWGGAANPAEYGELLAAAAFAIHSIGDPRIVVLNGPLSPGGNIDPVTFLRQMFEAVPSTLWAWDLYAAHPYPANHPPNYNIHNGTAKHRALTIDAYLNEVEEIARWGRTGVRVFLSETGYELGNSAFKWEGFPTITESNRADYMVSAFDSYWRQWPEVMGVAPYQLSDRGGAWSTWNWIDGGGAHDERLRLQYTKVRDKVDKSRSALASQLRIRFQAYAGQIGGEHFSQIVVTARGEAVSDAGTIATVTVLNGTPPPTATPTPTETATPSPTWTPTLTPTATPIHCPGDIDTYEPNESHSEARLMSLDDFRIEATLHNLEDVDWFYFTRPVNAQESRYLIQTVTADPGLRVRSEVYDVTTNALLAGGEDAFAVEMGVNIAHFYVRTSSASLAPCPRAYQLRVLDLATLDKLLYLPHLARDAEDDPTRRIAVDGLDRRDGWAINAAGLWIAETSADRVILVDPESGALRKQIAIPGSPFVVRAAETGIFVTAPGTNQVIAIDNEGRFRWQTTLDGLGLPQDLLYDAAAGRLFVLYFLAPRYGQIAILDADSGEILTRIEPTLRRPLQLASALSLDENGQTLWVHTAAGIERIVISDH
ncbi:MAG: DUF11 domain-containing protein [Caldilineaceae bacterium]|nr:DUF11 domain-containing protein [Caldilineaceae bacterium]